MNMKTTFIFLFMALISCQTGEIVDVTQNNNLDKIIESEFKRLQMPGLAYVAVKEDSIVCIGAKGYANVKEKKVFTPQTRMSIASISKIVVGTTIMQLYEDGLIALDEDISAYLPFKVRNPHFPNDKITVKMLLTHTATISDYGFGLYYVYKYEDYPVALMDFERDCLTEGGQYYSKNRFLKIKPGTSVSYTNIGGALLACLVEYVSGTDYNTFCKTHIFQPMEMTRTTWFFSETPQEEVALPYADNNIRNVLYCSFPTYPDGGLITTVEDYSKIMRAYIMGGTFNNFQLLKPETIDLMLQEYYAWSTVLGDYKQGLILDRYKIGNFNGWGHGGGDDGISSEFYFDRTGRIGYIMFSNREAAYSETLANALLLFADNY